MASNPLHLRPRVLVVDDNKAIHEDFLKILGGYTGGSAEHAASARSAMTSSRRPVEPSILR